MPAGLVTVAVLVISACGANVRTKEKVQEAILERLKARSGLDLNQLDVTATNVAFDRNVAHATVVFHPKNDTRVNSGMAMTYTLEDRDGKWVVTQVGDSQGHGILCSTNEVPNTLPPGHPPIDGASSSADRRTQ